MFLPSPSLITPAHGGFAPLWLPRLACIAWKPLFGRSYTALNRGLSFVNCPLVLWQTDSESQRLPSSALTHCRCLVNSGWRVYLFYSLKGLNLLFLTWQFISNARLIPPVQFLVPHCPSALPVVEDTADGNMIPTSPTSAPKEPGKLSAIAPVMFTESIS